MDSVKLIKLVKKRPILYDGYRPGTQYEERLQAWAEISELMGLPPDVCQTKWRNLRSTYNGYLRAQEKSKKNPTWHLYKDMSFLRQYLKRNRKSENESADDSEQFSVNEGSIYQEEYEAYNKDEAFQQPSRITSSPIEYEQDFNEFIVSPLVQLSYPSSGSKTRQRKKRLLETLNDQYPDSVLDRNDSPHSTSSSYLKSGSYMFNNDYDDDDDEFNERNKTSIDEDEKIDYHDDYEEKSESILTKENLKVYALLILLFLVFSVIIFLWPKFIR